jgi:hypothetical protein
VHELGLLTEEYKLYHWAIWKRFQDKHDEIGSNALQLYNARAGYEEKVAGGKHTYAELFQVTCPTSTLKNLQEIQLVFKFFMIKQ